MTHHCHDYCSDSALWLTLYTAYTTSSSSFFFSYLFSFILSSILFCSSSRQTHREREWHWEIERERERERFTNEGESRDEMRQRERESQRERPRDREREDPMDPWVGDLEENQRTGIRVTRYFRRSDPPCPAVFSTSFRRAPWPEPVTRRPERKTRFFLCVFRWLFLRNQWLFRWICYENPWGKILQPLMVYFVDWLDYCEIRVLWFWGFSMDWLGDLIN
jgi:hypothetical protein